MSYFRRSEAGLGGVGQGRASAAAELRRGSCPTSARAATGLHPVGAEVFSSDDCDNAVAKWSVGWRGLNPTYGRWQRLWQQDQLPPATRTTSVA